MLVQSWGSSHIYGPEKVWGESGDWDSDSMVSLARWHRQWTRHKHRDGHSIQAFPMVRYLLRWDDRELLFYWT